MFVKWGPLTMLLVAAYIGALVSGVSGIYGVADWHIYALCCLFVAAIGHAKNHINLTYESDEDEIWPY